MLACRCMFVCCAPPGSLNVWRASHFVCFLFSLLPGSVIRHDNSKIPAGRQATTEVTRSCLNFVSRIQICVDCIGHVWERLSFSHFSFHVWKNRKYRNVHPVTLLLVRVVWKANCFSKLPACDQIKTRCILMLSVNRLGSKHRWKKHQQSTHQAGKLPCKACILSLTANRTEKYPFCIFATTPTAVNRL